MKAIKVNGDMVRDFKSLDSARAKKNEGTREEKNARKVLEATINELNQKNDSVSFMFNGKPVATWTSNPRFDLDRTKLQTEFPEAYKACYIQGQVWTLDVL
jgi:hypothetical protein